MQIKDPKFKEGQKVRDIEDGDIYTVVEINRYSFSGNEYWYELEADRKEYTYTRPESKLETYIDKPKTVWELQDGDTYYSIYGNGNVSSEKKWFDDDYENNYREIGNVFLTKEEAEFEREHRKIETEMIRLGGRRTLTKDGGNYFLAYNHDGKVLMHYYNLQNQGTIYFDSKEQLNEVVKTIGLERIKKYIFGVES